MNDYHVPEVLFPAPDDPSLQVERQNLLALAREMADIEVHLALDNTDQARLIRRLNAISRRSLETNYTEVLREIARARELLLKIELFRAAIFRYEVSQTRSSLEKLENEED